MRLLLIASFPESLVRFRGDLIRDLVHRGIEVHIALPNSRHFESICAGLGCPSVSLHAIPLSRAGLNPLSDVVTLFSLVSVIRLCRPDVVLGYTVKPVIYGSISAWIMGVPLRSALVTGLGYAFTGQMLGLRFFVQRVVRGLYRLALSKNHVTFFQNADDRELFLGLGLIPPGARAIVLSGSGVNLDYYSVVPIFSQPLRFLMIARLLGDKGVREYVAAARILRERFANVEFRLVGWIDDNPDAISETELDDWVRGRYVTYLGRLDDVRMAIADSTVFVLPSYREGTPRTVLEAMAMGRPVITSDAPGCRETVVNGENGFLVPIKNVDALVRAMTEFIMNPGLAERMGRSSREFAEEKFDVKKVNEVILSELRL